MGLMDWILKKGKKEKRLDCENIEGRKMTK